MSAAECSPKNLRGLKEGDPQVPTRTEPPIFPPLFFFYLVQYNTRFPLFVDNP